MRTLIIYATLGLIAGALTAFFIVRGAQDFGEQLKRTQEQRFATWEELLK